MPKYSIWHVEHIKTITMTRQIFRYINLIMKVRKNKISKIQGIAKKVNKKNPSRTLISK